MGFFLPIFPGPIILLGNFLETGLKIVHGGSVLLGGGLFLQFAAGAFLGLLGGKLVLGFFLNFFLCFFAVGLVIGFFLVLLFLGVLGLILGFVLLQFGFYQPMTNCFWVMWFRSK